MFEFQEELDNFKKEIKTKKLTEQISGKLQKCVNESTIRDRVVDTRRLMSSIHSDSDLSTYANLVECDGWFIYIPSYTTIYQCMPY